MWYQAYKVQHKTLTKTWKFKLDLYIDRVERQDFRSRFLLLPSFFLGEEKRGKKTKVVVKSHAFPLNPLYMYVKRVYNTLNHKLYLTIHQT